MMRSGLKGHDSGTRVMSLLLEDREVRVTKV